MTPHDADYLLPKEPLCPRLHVPRAAGLST